jgi:predicted nucleotide-binding protein
LPTIATTDRSGTGKKVGVVESCSQDARARPTRVRHVRHHESCVNKPRIFLGSSDKQAKLLQAITRGLADVADVEPWTATFNPGRSTLDRLVELSQEVDFAAFVFARDDWITTDASQAGQPSPRDNVLFEAGLFGGALGIRRTFILHAEGTKLPSDLLGLTSVRYDPAASPAEVRAINQKLRGAIEAEGRRGPVEGLWWQLSLTERSEGEPSAVRLLRISRDRNGDLSVTGRGWQKDGTLSARYWSEAAKERRDPPGIFYFWKGERPQDPSAPQLEGTGELTVESADRATGYWTTRSDRDPGLNARTAGVYLRADPSDIQVLHGATVEERAQIIAQRLREWKSAANAF